MAHSRCLEVRAKDGPGNRVHIKFIRPQERWIEYAATIAGGRISAIKAKQTWDEWLANKDHVKDVLGPGGITQLYVRTDVEILEDDVYTKGKMVRRGDKVVKDATEEQLTKMRRRMQTGLDEVGEDRWTQQLLRF